MIDLGIGFNEMQWLVLVIFASTIFFKIGMRAGVEKAIVFSDLIERAPSGKPNYQWAQQFANLKLNIK